MAILKAVSGFVVVNADGSINMEATLKNVQGAITAELEAKASTDVAVEAALDQAFDLLKVDIYPTPEVVSIASSILVGNDVTKLAGAADSVRDYLERSARFKGERGRKGGLRRLSKPAGK